MVIKPMIRNNVCMNAHPVGCARYVQEQIDYVKSQGTFEGPKNVLVIGASNGYGLATRISAAFGARAATIGLAFEKPASRKRTASAGYYNLQAFDEAAEREGLAHERINADAFSHETKKDVVERIRERFGTVDLVVYSLASGVRTDPDTGEQYRSVLKPIGKPYHSRSVDAFKGTIGEAELEAATREEIDATVKVMGGDDWKLWMEALRDGGVLADGAKSIAYSYMGPELTRPIYRDGTIGQAKEHLESTAGEIHRMLEGVSGEAYVSINKGIVTRASAVIPVVPLYMSILFRVMKEKGLHEGAIEQMYRLFTERLYTDGTVPTDDEGRVRIDDWELRDDVQNEVNALFPQVTEETLEQITDIEQYRRDFLHLHGFGYDDIDYEQDVEP